MQLAIEQRKQKKEKGYHQTRQRLSDGRELHQKVFRVNPLDDLGEQAKRVSVVRKRFYALRADAAIQEAFDEAREARLVDAGDAGDQVVDQVVNAAVRIVVAQVNHLERLLNQGSTEYADQVKC